MKFCKRTFSAMAHLFLLSLGMVWFPAFVCGSTEYYRHVVFDNSLTPDVYFYSRGMANGSSLLELKDNRLPVEPKTFLTPPNALRLQWQSQAGGGWEGEVRVVGFRNRFPEFKGHNLYFWCFAPESIAADDLPMIVLSSTSEGLQVAEFPSAFSEPLPLGKIAGDIPARKWIQVRIPLSDFLTGSIYEFRPEYVRNVIFHQGRADGGRHTLIIDEIRVGDDTPVGDAASLSAPDNVRAIGYDRHVEVRWDPVNSPLLGRYVIYRSLDAKNFEPVGIQLPDTNRYVDFLGRSGVTAQYKVAASDWQYKTSSLSKASSASTREFRDDELLTMLQEACFHYYWEAADQHSGMTRENIPGDDRIIATGASGMGMAALIVGVDRGFVTRAQGIERLTRIVSFLEHAQRYHGAWSHYMDGSTGKTMPVFGTFDNGGDLVETSFLMQGCLPPASISAVPVKPRPISTVGSHNSGRQSNGTGIADRNLGTSSTGIGPPNGAGRSNTRSSDLMK
jgi:exo beta-1,2-glucooligosaccharide sophorohydrolase (non-reducing end)